MQRLNKAERAQALEIIALEADCGPTAAVNFLDAVLPKARELHRIYERQCNGHQTSSGQWDEKAANKDEAREDALERQLLQLGAKMGLEVYTQGDPRGNPVGIRTPKTGKYNTWGGAEDGWRF
jgi:hypothetical protein